MNKKFTKNSLLIVAIVFGIFVATGIAVVFEYKQPDTSNLTADIASVEVSQVEPSQEPVAEVDSQPAVLEAAQSEPQSPAAEPQIKDEEPKVVSKPKVAVSSSDPIVKNTNPVSTNVIVSPLSVAAGDSVTVTISIPGSGDLSSFWLTDVYLESPTGLNTVQGSIVNIDGEGRRFGSIAIPLGSELCTWIVKTIAMFDSNGGTTSYHYGTDIFATFTVVAPQ